jgi:hypothetical protein
LRRDLEEVRVGVGMRGWMLNLGGGGARLVVVLLRAAVLEKEYWRECVVESKKVVVKVMWVLVVEVACWVRFRHETAWRQQLG